MDWLTEGLNSLNYWLVLLAGAVALGIGILWYGDRLFGKSWRKEVDLTKEKVRQSASIGPLLIQTFILVVIGQSVLFAILIASNTTTLSDAVALAVVLGFAFNLTTITMNNLIQRRTLVLSAIDSGYQIIALVAGAAIFALWG